MAGKLCRPTSGFQNRLQEKNAKVMVEPRLDVTLRCFVKRVLNLGDEFILLIPHFYSAFILFKALS